MGGSTQKTFKSMAYIIGIKDAATHSNSHLLKSFPSQPVFLLCAFL